MKDLIRYPRNEDGERIGCLYAIYHEAHDEVVIGWSSYNADHEPMPFNKVRARNIARGRAVKGKTKGRMPDFLKKEVTSFLFKVNSVFAPSRVIIVDYDPMADYV